MAPTRDTSASAQAATTIHQEVRVRKNTTISKGTKKKSSNILIRTLESTTAIYGLELRNAIRLWSCLRGPSVVEDADSDRDDQTHDRQEVEMRDDELEEILSNELDNAEWTQRGSAPSRGPNESYRGGEKDGLFNGRRGRVPAGFRRKASGGDEDEETGSSGGIGGSGGGGGDKGLENYNSSSTHQPGILSLTATKRQPTTRLENCEYPCLWPDCTASVRYFPRKSAWSVLMNTHDRPFRCHFETCTRLAGFVYEWRWVNATESPSEHVDYEKRPDLKPYDDEASLEGHLEVWHNSASNPPLPRNGYEVTTLSEDWRHAGSAPSREGNENYDGGAQDGLFNGGCGRVPVGLSRRAAGGDGGDEDEEMGNSAGGNGGAGGGGGDEGGGGDDGDDANDGENPSEERPELSDSAERRRISNRIAQRNYRKKLKQRLQELEMRGGLSCKSPPQGYAESGEMHEMNGARVLEQEEAHVDAQYFQWQELDDNSKGMTPSKAPNECYYGGSKDALFTGGSARVPERLSDSAGSDGGDDGDGGVGEDDDKIDETQPQALQDYWGELIILKQSSDQEQMMLGKQLNKRTCIAKHGQNFQIHERPDDGGDYEMEDGWEREAAPKSTAAGETGSSFQFQYEHGDELTANPWVE